MNWKAVAFDLGLLLVCVAAPFALFVASLLLGASPALASLLTMIGYLGSFCLWVRLVPAMPGLLQGMVCVLGCSAILSAGLGFLISTVRFALHK